MVILPQREAAGFVFQGNPRWPPSVPHDRWALDLPRLTSVRVRSWAIANQISSGPLAITVWKMTWGEPKSNHRTRAHF